MQEKLSSCFMIRLEEARTHRYKWAGCGSNERDDGCNRGEKYRGRCSTKRKIQPGCRDLTRFATCPILVDLLDVVAIYLGFAVCPCPELFRLHPCLEATLGLSHIPRITKSVSYICNNIKPVGSTAKQSLRYLISTARFKHATYIPRMRKRTSMETVVK